MTWTYKWLNLRALDYNKSVSLAHSYLTKFIFDSQMLTNVLPPHVKMAVHASTYTAASNVSVHTDILVFSANKVRSIICEVLMKRRAWASGDSSSQASVIEGEEILRKTPFNPVRFYGSSKLRILAFNTFPRLNSPIAVLLMHKKNFTKSSIAWSF